LSAPQDSPATPAPAPMAGTTNASPGPEGGTLFRGVVAYDGGRFHGWQFQPRLPTVQGEIERALGIIVRSSSRVQGAGRTDAGVHALNQTCSFRAVTVLAPERLQAALNAHLPPDIRIRSLDEAPEGFSARFSARWRSYRYLLAREASPFWRGRAHVPRSWPDPPAMQAACEVLLGEHEFRAFTTQPEAPFGCCIHEIGWSVWRRGLVFTVRSNRFLYQMVRILVGTFLEIGRGRLRPEQMGRILEGGDRRAAGPLVPACGLYLHRVGYDPPWPEEGALETALD